MTRALDGPEGSPRPEREGNRWVSGHRRRLRPDRCAASDSRLSDDDHRWSRRDCFRRKALATDLALGNRFGNCDGSDAGIGSEHRDPLVCQPARSGDRDHDQRQCRGTGRLSAALDGDRRRQRLAQRADGDGSRIGRSDSRYLALDAR